MIQIIVTSKPKHDSIKLIVLDKIFNLLLKIENLENNIIMNTFVKHIT